MHFQPDADIRLSGHVSWVGKSTMEVVVWLEQFQHGEWQKITRAIFLMAARNSTNTRSAIVNSLTATNDEEKKILDGGIGELTITRQGTTMHYYKKISANNFLWIFHILARKLRRSEVQKSNLLRMTPDINEQHIIHQLFLDTVDSNDLTFERRVLPPNGCWISDTSVTNIINSHPEVWCELIFISKPNANFECLLYRNLIILFKT